MTTPTQPAAGASTQEIRAFIPQSVHALPKIIFVTGTDTGVGKTITTAALAAALSGHVPNGAITTGPGAACAVPATGDIGAASRSGRTVAVYKPVQTGVLPDEPGDIDEVRRLSGARVSEGIRLRDPMAPAAAAHREGAVLPGIDEHVRTIESLAATAAHVLVEGAGGLLVGLDGEGHTLADLASRFPEDCGTVVVVRSGLGTLNHTLLTLEALRTRNLPVAGLVIGSWPAEPNAVELDNLGFLRRLDVEFLGVIRAATSLLVNPDLLDQAELWMNKT